ncbi:hypothetical protein [Rhodococcus sp. 1168]|nr:hypothetical protein [Rhodococcus sp. 1168]
MYRQSTGVPDAGATLFTVGIGGSEYDLTDLHDAIGWRNSQQ